jgi:hypothetical protein
MRLTLDDCTYGASKACVLLSRRLTRTWDCALPAHEGNQRSGLQISGNPDWIEYAGRVWPSFVAAAAVHEPLSVAGGDEGGGERKPESCPAIDRVQNLFRPHGLG